MKIFLIGMPGSGKTTIGSELADKLGLPFIDLDHEIEKHEGSIVKDIFSAKGEAYFRLAESNALKRFTEMEGDFVLATGGGAPCFHNGIQIINASGISIFLDVPVRELVIRLEKNTDRPLLAASANAMDHRKQLEQKLGVIQRNRLTWYTQATITVVNPTLDSVFDRLKNLDLP